MPPHLQITTNQSCFGQPAYQGKVRALVFSFEGRDTKTIDRWKQLGFDLTNVEFWTAAREGGGWVGGRTAQAGAALKGPHTRMPAPRHRSFCAPAPAVAPPAPHRRSFCAWFLQG